MKNNKGRRLLIWCEGGGGGGRGGGVDIRIGPLDPGSHPLHIEAPFPQQFPDNLIFFIAVFSNGDHWELADLQCKACNI